MRQVTKEQFFERIYAEGLDVQPRIINDVWPYVSVWEYRGFLHTKIYGKTIPADRDQAASYFLAE